MKTHFSLVIYCCKVAISSGEGLLKIENLLEIDYSKTLV